MKAGKLRFPVKIERNHPALNAVNEPVPDWRETASVDADIEPLTGREFFDAQQINSEITTKITIRYLPDVSAKDRVTYGERTFEILYPMNMDERNHTLVLMCRETAP